MSTPNTAGLTLKEPEKIDWDNLPGSGKYVAPPVPIGVDGKPIVYQGQVPAAIPPTAFDADNEGNRRFLIDNIKIVKSGNGADGYVLRFTRVSTKPFTNRKTGEKMNLSSVVKYLKSCGIQGKPQTNAEYDQAVRQTAGRICSFTIDWEARDKATGQQIRGYENFPLDPQTGRRKAILRQGDVLPDGSTVTAEVMFANGRVQFFQTPNSK